MDINHNINTAMTNSAIVGSAVAINNFMEENPNQPKEQSPTTKQNGSVLSKLNIFSSKVMPSKQDNNSKQTVAKMSNGHAKTVLQNGHATLTLRSGNGNQTGGKLDNNNDNGNPSAFIEMKNIDKLDGKFGQRDNATLVGATGASGVTRSPRNIGGEWNEEGDDGGGGTLMRVGSARQSEKLDTVSFENEVDTKTKDGATNSSSLSEDFEQEIHDLVQEITTKVLIAQPTNINSYIADYLEDKLKRERKKLPKPKPKPLLRQNSTVGKMLFRHASLLAKTAHNTSKSNTSKPSFRDLVSNAQSASATCYYDVPKEPRLSVLKGHKDQVTQCSFHHTFIVTSSLDTTISIFDIHSGRKVISIPNHKPVHCFVLIPSHKNKILILAGTDDGQVPGWRVKFGHKVNAKLKVMIPMHQPNPIRAMQMSPNLKYLATGCCFVMKQISLWGYIEPSVRGTLKTWDLTSVINYALDPKNYYDDIEHLGLKTYKQIIARTEKLTQRMASYHKLTERDSSDETYYGIRALAFTPDETKIMVGFGHPEAENIQDIKMMAIVEVESLETVWLQYASFYQINAMVFDPTCGQPGGTWPWSLLVTTEKHLYRAELEVKDESNEKSKIKIKFPWRLDFTSAHQGGAFSPDGGLIVSSSGNQVLLFESSSGKQLGSYSGHRDNITHLSFSSNGEYIGTASKDKTVSVWKVPVKMCELPNRLKNTSSLSSKLKLPIINDSEESCDPNAVNSENSLLKVSQSFEQKTKIENQVNNLGVGDKGRGSLSPSGKLSPINMDRKHRVRSRSKSPTPSTGSSSSATSPQRHLKKSNGTKYKRPTNNSSARDSKIAFDPSSRHSVSESDSSKQ